MDLTSLLSPDLVKIGMASATKPEAIAEMVDFLVAKGKLRAEDRDGVLAAVMDREASLSTGMEHGVALPHGAVDAVPELVGALGISPKGIEFACLDGKPAHFIVCLIVPRQRTSRHVRTLAGIAHLLTNESLRQRLLGAKTPVEAMGMITAEEKMEGLEL